MPTPTKISAARSDSLLLMHRADHGIVVLTLNRPDERNSLSTSLMAKLKMILNDLAQDHTTRVIVLAAKGAAFCAGHDLKEIRAASVKERYDAIFAQCSELMLAIQHQPQPVIAQVQGIATAAGCQIVATCDLAIAGERATFATPGVDIGLFCSTPMVALTRAVSRKRAMEMLLTGQTISGHTALEIGLINRIVPDCQLSDETLSMAKTIALKSTAVLRQGKEAFYNQIRLTTAEAYAYTSQVMTENMLKQDATEGISAFLEKREPAWKDC